MATTTKKENLSGNNLLIVMILVSIIVIAVTVFASKVLITNIIRDTKVVTAKKTADDNLKKNLVNAPKLVEQYESLNDQATVLGYALPTTSDFPSLIVALENIAADAGFKLKSISPVQSVAAEGTATTDKVTPQSYPFTIQFDGSYDSLKKALKDIEIYARPMRVLSMQLSGTGAALNGTINLETYYQDKAKMPYGTETIK